jgi:hypothetical protein
VEEYMQSDLEEKLIKKRERTKDIEERMTSNKEMRRSEKRMHRKKVKGNK